MLTNCALVVVDPTTLAYLLGAQFAFVVWLSVVVVIQVVKRL